MTTTAERPPKPQRMQVDVDAVPTELKELRRWVVWSWNWNGAKWDKPPKQIDGADAKSNDPATWYSFAEVLAALDKFSGVGFRLLDSGIAGVDLDDCRDPETGIITEPHSLVIARLNTYAEVSPSGKGVKLLAYAKLPARCRKANHADGFECYDKQYFTLTGHRVPGTPPTIENRQQEIEWVLNTYVAKRQQDNGKAAGNLAGFELVHQDDRETAISALGSISNSGSGLGYDDWLRVGMALHSVSSDLLSEWIRWSDQSDKHVESECRRKWQSFNGQGDVTIGTLIFMAKERGWVPPTKDKATGKQQGDHHQDDDAATAAKHDIANCQIIERGDKSITIPMSMADIIATTDHVTGKWPRRVGDALFVPGGNDVAFLRTESALFAYYHERASVHWTRGARYVTKSELFEALKRTATSYDAVETFPHEPPMPGHFYVCGDVQAGDGDHLRELVDRFSPATDIDHDLILAMFVTPGWGGPAGCRPAFCITSDYGRGMGKSKLAELVGLLWAGVLTFSQHEDIGRIKTRMLTPDAMTKRVALLDNLKSLRFSWAELEAMVTSDTIGGHRMYCGEGTRPNVLSWIITLNGASLSTDVAQRSVIIKLDRPSWSGTWLDATKAFINDHRQDIIRDVVGFLRSDAATLAKFSRWSNWERDVLARLPEPAEAQQVIAERQGGADVEAEEAETIEDYFRGKLKWLGYGVDEWVFIPSGIANQWYNAAQNDKATVSQSTRLMNQMVTEGRLKRLRAHRMDQGRGFLWAPTGVCSVFATDLGERLARSRE